MFIPTGARFHLFSPSVTLNDYFLPTGFQSKELIVSAQLRLGDVDQYPTIDVTIDGADELSTVSFSLFSPFSFCISSLCVRRRADDNLFSDLRVDHDLNCIKGGGACHLREKVLAEAADTCVSLPDSPFPIKKKH